MSGYNGGVINGGVDWEYFDKFKEIKDEYLPSMGEGENMATQIVTATAKLVYKWYNDGDVYDNQHKMEGWCNDLSSYANWLYENAKGTDVILYRIMTCKTHAEYEQILKDLVDITNTKEYLKEYENQEKHGTIYDCLGPFIFDLGNEEEEAEEF